MTTKDIIGTAFLIVLSKMIGDNLPDFSIKNYLRRRNQMIQVNPVVVINEQKMTFIRNIGCLCECPEFEIETPAMNLVLISTFYELAVEVTQTFTVKEENFNYYRDNYCLRGVENKEQLIESLVIEKANPQRNDSRYLLGLRSIYFILRQNLDRIDDSYMNYINTKLAPFWQSHKVLVYNQFKRGCL